MNKAVTLEKGSANWDFVRSFREYVGLDGETRTDVTILPGNRELE